MDSGVIDAEPSGGHGLETGGEDLLAARLTCAVGAVVELREGTFDLVELVAELGREGLVLALLGGNLARVGEVVIDLAVVATGLERVDLRGEVLPLSGQLASHG